MAGGDHEFYQNQQKTPPIGYCQSFVDRKWETSNKRKLKRMNRSRDESFDQTFVNSVDVVVDDDVVEDSSSDKDYEFEAKKRKYDFNFVNNKSSDDLPFKYRHIRDGLRSVKPEIYFVISKLSSDFHMSQNQIEGSIITIANELFGRKEFGEWKLYDRLTTPDNNTLPSLSNIRRTESYMEAMALNFIVQEIMNDGKLFH